MKRIRFLPAWTVLCALITLLFSGSQSDRWRREAVCRRYDGRNGVLRLWAREGFEAGSGSLTSWLDDRG